VSGYRFQASGLVPDNLLVEDELFLLASGLSQIRHCGKEILAALPYKDLKPVA
jgi:hypothetical protein